MRQLNIVLIFGSAPDVTEICHWDLSIFTSCIAINNAWKVTPHWTHLIFPEDFPIDLKFTVVLSPTKPRDGADIRQTFNLGRIDYTENFVGHTYDKANTYGIENKNFEIASRGNPGTTPDGKTTDARVAQVATWLNNRYGAGMGSGNNETFLTSVYFHNPPEKGSVGGSEEKK